MIARCSAVLLLLLSAVPLFAQTLPPPFEAVMTARRSPCPPDPVSSRGVVFVNPDRTDLVSGIVPVVTSLGSADGRRVLGTQEIPGTGFRLVEVRPDGSVIPIGATTIPRQPLAIAVARNGFIYVPVFIASIPATSQLYVFNAEGVVVSILPLPHLAEGTFALASDDCTLFYTSGGLVRRFNACTGASSDFNGVPGDYTDIFLLPDGRVLLSDEQSIVLYNADGTVNRTVVADINTLGGLGTSSIISEIALSSDLQTLYVTNSVNCTFDSSARMLQLSFATGAELSRRLLNVHGTGSLIIGSPATASSNVPTASEWALLLLAIALGAAGVLAVRT